MIQGEETKSFPVTAGSMSHIHTGTGRPVVFVHGNPSSTTEYQLAIRVPSQSHR